MCKRLTVLFITLFISTSQPSMANENRFRNELRLNKVRNNGNIFKDSLNSKCRFYLYIVGGYGFEANKKSKEDISFYGFNHINEDEKFSLGKGINSGLYVGYTLTKNISFEFGSTYLFGSNSKSEKINSANGSKGLTSMAGSVLRLNPNLKISIGKKKIQSYFYTGFIFGIGANAVTEYNITETNGNSTEVNYKYYGGKSLGFNFGLGASIRLLENIKLFAEFASVYQSWAPEKEVMTKFDYNGVDKLPTLSTYVKETNFTSNPSNPYDGNGAALYPSEPRQAIKIYLPFSSMGINAGLRISFSK